MAATSASTPTKKSGKRPLAQAVASQQHRPCAVILEQPLVHSSRSARVGQSLIEYRSEGLPRQRIGPLLGQREQIGQALARVVTVGERIDHRNGRGCRETLDVLVLEGADHEGARRTIAGFFEAIPTKVQGSFCTSLPWWRRVCAVVARSGSQGRVRELARGMQRRRHPLKKGSL